MIRGVFIDRAGKREQMDFETMEDYIKEAARRYKTLVFTSADTIRYNELRQGRNA